jgi:hypothetical protein
VRFNLTIAFAGLALSSLVACNACSPTPEEPEVVLQTVDELLEGGDPTAALELLERHTLLDTPEGLLFAVEAWIMTGDYETAQTTLAERIDLDGENIVLLEDSCAMGCLTGLDNGNLERARDLLAACDGRDRIDLQVLRIRTSDEPATLDVYDALMESLQAAESGPEVDQAAAALEVHLIERADSAETPLLKVELLRRAFGVGQDPELGERVRATVLEAAESFMETDVQQAATLFEILYLRQIDGLEVSDEEVAHATSRAEVALFPVFVGNLWGRYERKFSEEDAAAGVMDLETRTFNVGPIDTDELFEAAIVWLFRRLERPRPTPTPDVLGNVNACHDRTVECTFPFQTFAAIAYGMSALERDYLEANPDVTFEWLSYQ